MARSWTVVARAVALVVALVALQSESAVAWNDCTDFTTRKTCKKEKANDCYWKKKKCHQKDNVYFVGNSFTIYRMVKPKSDMPALVQTLAKKGSVGKWAVDSYAKGSTFLKDHINNDDLVDEIFSRNRTLLVLQEQSQVLGGSESLWRSYSLNPTLKFAAKAKEKGIRVMLYETWGYGNSYTSFQNNLDTNYAKLAEAAGVELCPVGKVWRKAYEAYGNNYLDLYYTDKKHPSYLGHYLVASTFHACIHGESPEGIQFYPNDVTEAQAAEIHAWVNEVILDA
ncbi:Hypothetical Protein FCC1311_090852 [Hondaea fermentalgiana]|uniref:Uncharacterized protein n=1 Tax=Hondaea fermentalgiana TaxID=2315210 RepID=A0A2R5GPS6_9STRA|nr:Hypothetical Protein FCC1311_090852 [Hondaea fermentalgiana]|eukprot:GBG32860.1 Hypothetical Protein FCC1311_090852 [Hondaea fermentalgiana]